MQSSSTAIAAVVGAGPAGLAVVARLLDVCPPDARVAWIDPAFSSGRLSLYAEVPSNTSAALFVRFFDACDSLRHVVAADPLVAPLMARLRALPPDDGCPLRTVTSLVSAISASPLFGRGRLDRVRATATKIVKRAAEFTLHVDESLVLCASAPLVQSDSQSKPIFDASNFGCYCYGSSGPAACFAATNPAACRLLRASNVFLCTGSYPKSQDFESNSTGMPLARHLSANHIKLISIDTCLSPTALAAQQKILFDRYDDDDDDDDRALSVLVIGASHTGILCARNLCGVLSQQYNNSSCKDGDNDDNDDDDDQSRRRRRQQPRVGIFGNRPLIFAEPKPDEDWILHDNTGLKGEAARYARRIQAGEGADSDSAISPTLYLPSKEHEEPRYLSDIASVLAHARVTHAVLAIGFRRRQVPHLELDGKVIDHDVHALSHDATNASISVDGELVPRMFGFGIGFPESVTDRQGNVESNVGMWKFMKYVMRVVVAAP